jgi:hypothetical protein
MVEDLLAGSGISDDIPLALARPTPVDRSG